MNLMFWKKKPKTGEDADPPQDAADDKTVAMEVPDLEKPSKPGLLSRVKSGLAGFPRRFKKAPAPDEENEKIKTAEAPSKHASPEAQAGDAPPIRSRNIKKRLIIGGAISLLFLLLAGVGFATWKIFLSPAELDAAAPASADTSHDTQPADHAREEHAAAEQPLTEQTETHQAEIEALKKKNSELQAQIDALKNEQPQGQPSASPTGITGEKTSSASSTSELTISNKDPKAAAQVLKEAIEAMNAGSGGSGGSASKPAK